ncbi:MAG: thiamine-phosphate kinase [Chitinophagales bacterium]
MSSNNPEQQKLTPISELGEFGLIEHLNKNARQNNTSTLKGIGDDAAVIHYEKDKVTVVSTDLLVEGIHFDMVYTPLKHLGYKSVVVNLSDIFAMNAIPRQITVSIAVSSRFTVEALEEIYEGIHAACDAYGVDLVGGDTSSSRLGLVISVTAIGEAKADEIVYRDTAEVGDMICITGDLGGAYLGLQILEREKEVFIADSNMKPDLTASKYLIARQLKPEPRNDIIDILQNMKIKPTSMIDVSDGLSSDLLHICDQSNVGCRIFQENIPIHPDTLKTAMQMGLPPITCALSGGEDYELLFTVSPKDADRLEEIQGFSIIGRITDANKGRYLFTKKGEQHELIAQGWKHI